MKIFSYKNEEDLKQVLRLACIGGLQQFCRENGLNPENVSDILAGKKRMMISVVNALGFERVIIYRRLDA